MPAISSVTPFGTLAVDAVDSGTKWATNSLTYSFPTSASFYTGAFGMTYGSGEPSNNFKAFTTVQQNATATILGMYSAVANLTFTRMTESSTQTATLRYAESDAPTTAWGYDPSTAPEGGDAWFNNSTHWYDNPTVGNYAWLTIMHETGHLLGLKHPQDTSGSFGAVPASQDSLEYSVMSYRSYTGASTTGGLTNATWSFPTTLMEYDVAALQYMYGANYNTNSGNTVYSWNPNTGQESINGVAQTAPGGNTIFMTIWDGGGTDTYDFSNYTTNLSINLQPGSWTTTSTAQLANLGSGHYAIGNIFNALEYKNNPLSLIENAVGGAGNDTIIGNAANNKLTGGAGNDTIDGVSGTNTAVYSGASTGYQETQNSNGSWTVTDLRAGSPGGTDTLKNIEYLQFSDKTIALGTLPPPSVIAAPQLVSFSTDTGTVGDNITSDNTLTLNGTAEAGSIVKVYNGSTLLGSATANGSGGWTYTTIALSDGTHSLSATATDATGTSAASTAIRVTIDTLAPGAPTIKSGSVKGNFVTVGGTAEAGSTIKIYEGTTLLGSAAANGSGAWTYTTSALTNGVHSLAATATDVAGNTSLASTALTVTVAPGTPRIASFSKDTGTVGDNITSDNTLTLNGTAEAGSNVKVYDGSTLLGSATANGSGGWTYTTIALFDGTHSFRATATDAAGTSAASTAMSVTIDTIAPASPVIESGSAKGKFVTLDGTAEAGSTIKVYDGSTLLGSTTTSGSGTWTYETSTLTIGTHGLAATATDVAGNTSGISTTISVTKNSAAGDIVQTDLNFDGTADILWCDSNSGTVGTWLMSNGQVLQTNPIGVVSSNMQIAGTGDFNNDGTTDILWRDANTGTVGEWLMSNGQVSQTNTIGVASSNWQIVGTGDFNNDGTTDILWRDANTGTVGEWLMSNGHISQGNGIAVASSNLQVAGTGDFNNDGTTDILWRDKNTGTVSEWLMSNGQVQQTNTISSTSSNWHVLGTGDFNGDGTTDILYQDGNTGVVDAFQMSNGQLSQMSYLGTFSSNWQFLGTGDFNNDGTSDLLFRDSNTGAVNEWLTSSSGTLQSLTIGAAGSNWNTIAAHS